MTLMSDFARVSKSRPCPICGRPDWCLISRNDPPSAAICQRVESQYRWRDAGWLHRLSGTRDPVRRRRSRTIRISAAESAPDFSALSAQYQAALDPAVLNRFATSLGVAQQSLTRLGIGWTGSCWTFPMSAVDGRVIGIRLRTRSGRKFSEKGGHQGLHIPTELTGKDPLLLPEGPSDTAAALDLGFDAVGRPSCCGATNLTVALVRRIRPCTVVVVSDNDQPGIDGATDLARALTVACGEVRVLRPPSGIKDLRQWVCHGARRENVETAIAESERIRLHIARRRRHG